MLWIFWAQVPVAKASLCSPPSRVGSPRSLDLGSLQDANMYPFVPAQSACFVCCFNPHFGVTSTGCWISSLSSSLSIETEISTKRLSHLPCDTRRRLISVLSKLHHRRAAPRWILFDKLEEHIIQIQGLAMFGGCDMQAVLSQLARGWKPRCGQGNA